MSTLLTVRQKFCQLSGRFDLATTSEDSFDTDNGADFFINAGMKMLERRYDYPKEVGRYFDEVAAGSWYLTFQNCRVITEVWANNDEERKKLTKTDMVDLREYYTGLVSATDQDEPDYYAPAFIRAIDATDKDSLGSFFNYVKTDDDGTYNGIIFMPPVDEAYVIEVWGKFYSTELSSNTDENYWTNVHPMLLVWSALYHLEVSYRNSEGAKDWLSAIEMYGSDIDKDRVEEEIVDIEEMWG